MVSVFVPYAFVAARLTEYVPGVLYTTLGFCCVLVVGVPPSNDHSHDEGVLVEWSVKLTVAPASTVVLSAVKSTSGAMYSEEMRISSTINANLSFDTHCIAT